MLRLVRYVCACGTVRCKAALDQRVLQTNQPSRSWRRALIFASDHRGAPQKSAKRKRVHWVPYSFRVSEGSAEPFRSGSLAASVPAARYDANCCKISFPAGKHIHGVNFISIYTNRKHPCHTKSSLLLRGGDFFLPFYSSLPLLFTAPARCTGSSEKEAFPYIKERIFHGWAGGSVSGWDKVLFRLIGYGVSTGNRHTGHVSRWGYHPKLGRQGADSGAFTAVLD